jgi:hypothetical protein
MNLRVDAAGFVDSPPQRQKDSAAGVPAAGGILEKGKPAQNTCTGVEEFKNL